MGQTDSSRLDARPHHGRPRCRARLPWGGLGCAFVLALGSACSSGETVEARPPRPVAVADGGPPPTAAEAVRAARQEFEMLGPAFAVGTSSSHSRGDFLPLDDPRAMSEGDFIGRLRALFGVVEGDQYVLRHRASGFVITAYSAQSGPSYGGGAPIAGGLDVPPPEPSHAKRLEEARARDARIEADRVLARDRVEWGRHDRAALTPAQLLALREQEHRWTRRLDDVAALPGFDRVVARLDELVSAVQPVDWGTTRYHGDEPSVYRVGARGGQAFREDLSVADGLEALLSPGEDMVDSSGSPGYGPDFRAVEYCPPRRARTAAAEGAAARPAGLVPSGGRGARAASRGSRAAAGAAARADRRPRHRPRPSRGCAAGRTGRSARRCGQWLQLTHRRLAARPRGADRPARDPEVEWAGVPAGVHRVLDAGRADALACYAPVLATRPHLAGRVVLALVVDPNGRVASVELRASTLSNATVETCLAGAARRWRFPARTGGQPATLEAAFLLMTAGE